MAKLHWLFLSTIFCACTSSTKYNQERIKGTWAINCANSWDTYSEVEISDSLYWFEQDSWKDTLYIGPMKPTSYVFEDSILRETSGNKLEWSIKFINENEMIFNNFYRATKIYPIRKISDWCAKDSAQYVHDYFERAKKSNCH